MNMLLKDFNIGLSKIDENVFNTSIPGLDHEFEEVNDYMLKKDGALFDTVEALREMNDRMEQERTDRIMAESKASKNSRRNFICAIIGVTIGLLTLIATVSLGILGLLR